MKNMWGSKIKVVSTSQASVLKVLPSEVTELVSGLLPEDLEILAYLIACSSETRPSAQHCKRSKRTQSEIPLPEPIYVSVSIENSDDASKLARVSSPVFNAAVQFRKPALFECNCFQCYTSYWSRWDASPNRGKIDEAIAVYEEHIENTKSQRKQRGAGGKGDRKGEGKGRGRQDKVKQQQEAKSEHGAPGSVKKTDALVPIEGNLLGEDVQEKRKEASKALPRDNGRAKVTDKQGKLSSPNSPVKAKDTSSTSSSTSPGDKSPHTKDGRVKPRRVAPYSSDTPSNNIDETTILQDEAKEDPSALLQGKRLVSFVATRLWGFWDRRVPEKIVDVC